MFYLSFDYDLRILFKFFELELAQGYLLFLLTYAFCILFESFTLVGYGGIYFSRVLFELLVYERFMLGSGISLSFAP
jgi:hypothetical protein